MRTDTTRIGTRTSSSVAERMRLYRKRRRDGTRLVRIHLDATEIDDLIRMGFLRKDQREDAEWLQTAVRALIYWVLEEPECLALRTRQRRTRAAALRLSEQG